MHRLLRRSWVQVVLGAVMLMSVIVASGRPTVFTDTDDYFAQGRGAAHAVKPLLHAFMHSPKDDEAEEAYVQAEADEDHTSMAARSPYYGILLYGANKIGTLWLLAAIQSAVAAWTVFALVRAALRPKSPAPYLSIMAGVSVATTLPFFTGFAMPDVFAALGAAATVALAIYWSAFGRRERVALILVITASLWFHTSHVLLEVVLIAAVAAVLWWFRTEPRTILLRTGVLSLLVVSAAVSDLAYHEVVKLRTGEDLHRPPFLIARVLADGPGRVYLRQACAKSSPYVLCRFRFNPLDDSDEILWADDPARGIFNASKVPVRIALEREEKAFVASTIAHYPLSQLAASLSNWAEQLALIDLAEPLRDPTYYFTSVYWKDTSLPGLIPDGQICLKHPQVCRSRFSISDLEDWHRIVLYAAAAFLLWRLSRKDVRNAVFQRAPMTDDGLSLIVATSLLLVMAVIMNAAVTGILSGPFARYSARIVWLTPMLALLVLWQAGPGFDVRPVGAYVRTRAIRLAAHIRKAKANL